MKKKSLKIVALCIAGMATCIAAFFLMGEERLRQTYPLCWQLMFGAVACCVAGLIVLARSLVIVAATTFALCVQPCRAVSALPPSSGGGTLQTAELLSSGKPVPQIAMVECVFALCLVAGGIVIYVKMKPLCQKVKAGATIRRPGLDDDAPIIPPTTNCAMCGTNCLCQKCSCTNCVCLPVRKVSVSITAPSEYHDCTESNWLNHGELIQAQWQTSFETKSSLADEWVTNTVTGWSGASFTTVLVETNGVRETQRTFSGTSAVADLRREETDAGFVKIE